MASLVVQTGGPDGSRYAAALEAPQDGRLVLPKGGARGAQVRRRPDRVPQRSLRTKDKAEAKLRYPAVAAEIDAILQEAKGGPRHLTTKEVHALAAEWYRRELRRGEDDPGDHETLVAWEFALDDIRDDCLTDEYRDFEHDVTCGRGGGREPPEKFKSCAFVDAVRKDVDALLQEERVLIDEDSRCRLSWQILERQLELYQALQRRAKGDYTSDEPIRTAPAWARPPDRATVERTQGTTTTLSALLEAWVEERRPSQKTAEEWQSKVRRLRDFLGHEDAEALRRGDLIRWKDQLLKDRKPKTAKNHVDVIHALLGWAIDNERVRRSDNPARGVKVDVRRRPGEDRKPYSRQDASAILSAARQEKGIKRWVPWLLAFTGARLDEVCQALTTDVREDEGIWYLDINAHGPGKTLKNLGSARSVPLHDALIAEGFLDHVRSLPEGPLFPDAPPDRFGRRGGTAGKRLSRWVREKVGIKDPQKAPSHSWRHLFKDLCREAEIEKAVSDALTTAARCG